MCCCQLSTTPMLEFMHFREKCANVSVVLLWRQLKGCRVLPAGVSGASPEVPFLLSPPQAASKKRKRFFGDTPNPGKGRLPFAIPQKKRSVDAKGGVLNMFFYPRALVISIVVWSAIHWGKVAIWC